MAQRTRQQREDHLRLMERSLVEGMAPTDVVRAAVAKLGISERHAWRELEEALGLRQTPLLEQLRQDPARLMDLAEMPPDPWQAALLRSAADRVLLLCSRQAGKSQAAAALALKAALLEPPALVLLLSP